MKTVAQVLRMVFWMQPMQRALLLFGGCLSIGLFWSGKAPPVVGVLIAVLLPVLTAGMFLRKLVAPRHAMLWPHGRGRLLVGTLGTIVVVTLLLVLGYGLEFIGAPPRYRPDTETYAMWYVLLFVLWSQCTISMFIASRSPAWALLVLIAWLLPGIVMRAIGAEDVPRLLTGPAGIAVAAVMWIVFIGWFLTVRRIGDARWRMREGAVAVNAQLGPLPATREIAMQRWLLNSGTPLSIGLQWAIAAIVLVAVQLAIPRMIGGDSPPRWVTAMMFGTLSLGAAAVGALSWTIAKRSRWLWLTAGRSRPELFGWCEQLMLKTALAVMLPLALLALLMWYFLHSRPVLPPAYLLLAMVAPVLAAGWFGLMQISRRIALDVLAAGILVAGWYFGLILPLFGNRPDPRWELVFAELAFVVLLRGLAYGRWRAADWPRVQPKPTFD
jgi:hypothetical protein